jgi:hypothetical protein
VTAVVVLLSVLLVVVVVAVAGLAFHTVRADSVRTRLRSRVVVTLKSGAGFDGVLYAADRTAWVLRNVSALGAGDRSENVPVDGEVVILTSDIDFAQRP